ncbi:DNA-binding protein [Ectopseudomonas toyotomiensis]|uniref:Phage-associated protein, BcepMu gp16 family n=1 Tax=Ectopseudomonas toyotomiensis TaxID=554344 RepID=A0A1I5Z551_9GAMM|nr:DNA-binding protein [Pseudomonas toyotomiensis]PIA65993.1 DNA-binding protein [Pseudomonas toyotomiensis]SFQ51604.1 phage-associated protein, BcepMu gp16 family [Pseudomonas toyotomiensis]
MATQQKPKTVDQVKAEFRAKGLTVNKWAEDNKFPPGAVYQVLNGFSKGNYGQSHDIAVALGLKAGEAVAA